MGLGDNLMATGLARGFAKRGKVAAFGDGKKIIWDHNSEEIFRNNPNIARPGHERRGNVVWIPFHRGNRQYNVHDRVRDRWVWNYDFNAKPGEMFFAGAELAFANQHGGGFVVIEPNLPEWKSSALNKRWPVERYDEVASRIAATGRRVIQFNHGAGHRLTAAEQVKTPSFRHALAIMARASLYIGPEGGLHHGAAAVSIPAVVLFGGFIPPSVTGYDTHVNLTGGASDFCGSLQPCLHCKDAMAAITCEEVLDAADTKLKEAA